MPESMDFNWGNSTCFQQRCISALDYPWLHASGSSRQNICGAIFAKTFRIKQQLVWQWNFPVGMFCLQRTDIQNGFWDFSSVRIGGLIQIFDADHSTLYADFLLPVISDCFEGSLVSQNARVSHQMSIAWHLCNFFVSFVFYFAICFAIEGTVVDFSLWITVFDITGFPASVLAFAYVFTFSARSCLLIL